MAVNSSWIVDSRILACPYPGAPEVFAELAEAGIGLCINLHERPLPIDALHARGLAELHLPVPDFTAPPPEVLLAAVHAIDAALAEGHGVAVNCGAGLGRTGTVIAAWLVSKGASADEAIARVRTRRPGSVETPDQENAVRRFADACTSNAH